MTLHNMTSRVDGPLTADSMRCMLAELMVDVYGDDALEHLGEAEEKSIAQKLLKKGEDEDSEEDDSELDSDVDMRDASMWAGDAFDGDTLNGESEGNMSGDTLAEESIDGASSEEDEDEDEEMFEVDMERLEDAVADVVVESFEDFSEEGWEEEEAREWLRGRLNRDIDDVLWEIANTPMDELPWGGLDEGDVGVEWVELVNNSRRRARFRPVQILE
ncbi:hypothetical protein AJ79_05548 [Helicocarpus griseus UAMH5409]|uniref:Uncharacterized protein n=1 Tax=Helicocarpus griseus UAMH5409 TaxID=1447875 RepID=A0A2B7XMQ4_9EURO|nr:hypothetical protein AJ79_05548 [Helicocarpus griseus UAMH5409]